MAYSWANRAGKVAANFVRMAMRETGSCCTVSKRLMYILIASGVALLLLLVVAWLDGGQVEQRQIVQPVSVPENNL